MHATISVHFFKLARGLLPVMRHPIDTPLLQIGRRKTLENAIYIYIYINQVYIFVLKVFDARIKKHI